MKSIRSPVRERGGTHDWNGREEIQGAVRKGEANGNNAWYSW